MRWAVAATYLLGAFVTAAGVLIAFSRARRDLRQLNELEKRNLSYGEPDLEAVFDDLEGEPARRAAAAQAQSEIDEQVRALGFPRVGGTTFSDMRLPLDYWAKRSALRDAVESFKFGGLVALLGLLISTGASVWSLFLPTS